MISYKLSSDEFCPQIMRRDINGNVIEKEYTIYETQQSKIQIKIENLIDDNHVYFPLSSFERTENDSLFVGIENKKIIGFAFSRPFNFYREYCTQNNDNWYLEYVLVDKNYRRNGYALQLLTECAEFSKQQGAKTLSSLFLEDGAGKKLFDTYTKLHNKKVLAPIRNFEATIEL